MRKNRIAAASNDFTILALDDDPIMTATLQSYFQTSGYRVEVENDPFEAIERVRGGSFDILLLDFLMSPICGDEVVARIREFNTELYIILLTGHKSLAPPIRAIRELDIQGYYEKSDRFDQLELLVESCVKSIRQMRTIKAYQRDLDRKNKELYGMYTTLGDNYMEVISALRLVVDARDIYTRGHSDRVSYYAEHIARQLQEDDVFIEKVRLAGLFHDVGKVAVADSILLKPGRLTEEEFSQIKLHPGKGKEILSAITAFSDISEIVWQHHERYDGRGYPLGLSRAQARDEARIISVSDAFDAMTSHRLYRDNLTFDQAVEQLKQGRGTQFDPDAVDAFLEALKDYEDMQEELQWTYKPRT